MNIRFLTLLALLGTACLPSAAQNGNIYLEDSSIQVVQSGGKRNLAWSGGFNSPQFANADLNKDGLKDLVVYEWKERVLRTFINKGTATSAYYVYAPRYAKAFPLCYDYVHMPDYNRDNIPDLIQKGGQGFAIYKGFYNGNNELNFTFYRDLRYDSPVFGNINAYTQGSDIPGVIDVDGDGDIDFFGFDVNGGIVSFYKNCQVELGLPKDTIRVCNPTNCWGHIFQSYERTYLLGIVPSSTSNLCPTLGNFGCKLVEGENQLKDTRHQGNCMLLLDYDGDGDVDMLDGNISFSDLQFLRNGRAQYGGTDSMISQDTLWQTGGKRLYMPNWPAASYADADGDGKRDILVSPHDFAASEDYRCIAWYKNTGTAATPIFTYQHDTFLVERAVDAGTASYPVLYDYNRDGRLDLFVGSEGYFQPGGTYRSRISYYQNSASGSITSLVWQTGDFNNLFAQNFSGAAPAFGDIDGDGMDDMVIGHTDGTLTFYKNMATSNLVVPQWTLNQFMLKSSAGDTIDVGYSSTPYIYDINKDGKPDLLIGNQSGRLAYFQNNSTGAGPSLSFVTATLGNVKADTNNTFSGYSSFWIGKMDVTGLEYLVSGNSLGHIVRYTGFQGGNVSTPYNLLTDHYNSIETGRRSTVTAGDIDGDGRTEMIIGNSLGGLYLYKQGPVVGVAEELAIGGAGCSIYPNPARTELVVTWEARFAAGEAAVQVSLFNALGQLVRQKAGTGRNGATTVDVSGLPSGIYTCRVATGGKTATMKLSVME